MMLLDLLPELLLRIICCAYSGDARDIDILCSLPLVSKALSKFMTQHYSTIIEHYTVVHRDTTWIEYLVGKKPHRDGNLPAIIFDDGAQYWCQYGKYHRNNDKPAIVFKEIQCWYQQGLLHRDEDKPAEIYSHGTQKWYYRGLYHRDNDRPAAIYAHGTVFWYQHGQVHRDNDRPAITWKSGTQAWYCCDELRRDEDKPAVIRYDGSQEWVPGGNALGERL